MDEKFKNIIAEILKISPENLNKASTPTTLPQWDSLTHWALIGELEDNYEIEFTIDEATAFKNLGDIYNSIINKLA